MTIEKLRAVREANPFQPFTVHLADGRSLPVPHRDYLSMSPGGSRTVIIYGKGEDCSIIDVYLITELAFDKVPSLKSGNESGE